MKNRFTLNFNEVFYWKNFLQPLLLVYGISMAIFLYLTVKYENAFILNILASFNYDGFMQQNNWTAGIGHSCCCYIQLFILCDVGKTVNDAVILTKSINQYSFFLFNLLKKTIPVE